MDRLIFQIVQTCTDHSPQYHQLHQDIHILHSQGFLTMRQCILLPRHYQATQDLECIRLCIPLRCPAVVRIMEHFRHLPLPPTNLSGVQKTGSALLHPRLWIPNWCRRGMGLPPIPRTMSVLRIRPKNPKMIPLLMKWNWRNKLEMSLIWQREGDEAHLPQTVLIIHLAKTDINFHLSLRLHFSVQICHGTCLMCTTGADDQHLYWVMIRVMPVWHPQILNVTSLALTIYKSMPWSDLMVVTVLQ